MPARAAHALASLGRSVHRLPQALAGLPAALRWGAEDRLRYLRARLHRARLAGVRFVAITGSAGKTTTKDLAVAILSGVGPCHSSAWSFNDRVHVERTVLRTRRDHRFCIVEVGAMGPGYLDRPLRVVQPEIGVLTLVAREHYSAFRSLEAIAEEKGKLIASLPPHGTAVLNVDDPQVRAIGERHRGPVIWVGTDEKATLRLLEARSRWPEPLTLTLGYAGRTVELRTRLHGRHLAVPALSALGIALAAGVDFDEALAALAGAEPAYARMQIQHGADGVVFVRDDWKAPQWSFGAPLAFLGESRAQRKVAVIGTISDSVHSPSKRYALAARDALAVADLVVLVGTKSLEASRSARVPEGRRLAAFASLEEAARFMRHELRAGDLVLLKGTNKQDHLVRLILDREEPIACWDPACGREQFCGGCPRLYEPSPARAGGSPATAEAPATLREPGDGSACGEGSRENGQLLPGEPRLAASQRPVVVGMGNPGERHRDTPHNLGHRVVEALAEAQGASWRSEAQGLVATVELEGGRTVTLLKPDAKINLTGPLLREFLAADGRGTADCILVHDDLDLPLGSARTRRRGGDGGHKGMQSVIASLGTDELARVRVGARRAGREDKAKDLVLAGFASDDRAALQRGVERAVASVRSLLAERGAKAGEADPGTDRTKRASA